jgi:protein-S-isoprenylcysteine O-methyltransferase Ste14
MEERSTPRKRQKERYDLTEENAAGKIGQIIVFFIFAAVWIIDSFFLKYTAFLNTYVPLAVRIPLGVIFIGLSFYLAGKGLSIVFDDDRKKSCVVRESVFKVVRHPVYLSEIGLYFGLFLISMSLASLFVWVCAFLFFHRIACYEEKMLLERFGKEYEEYMREAGMWFPRLRKK